MDIYLVVVTVDQLYFVFIWRIESVLGWYLPRNQLKMWRISGNCSATMSYRNHWVFFCPVTPGLWLNGRVCLFFLGCLITTESPIQTGPFCISLLVQILCTFCFALASILFSLCQYASLTGEVTVHSLIDWI